MTYKKHFQPNSVNLFIQKQVKLSVSWLSSLKTVEVEQRGQTAVDFYFVQTDP